MGYLSIDNLYRNQTILMFRRGYSLEKVHGTSAHIHYKSAPTPGTLENSASITYFSGGEKYETFRVLFDHDDLLKRFAEVGQDDITVYGEAHGGKQQKMSATYGPKTAFIAFDVKVGTTWLNVPNAENVCRKLGIEFVPYHEIELTVENLDAERDRESEVAIRRGMGPGKKREGVVVRPLQEFICSNGDRVICKHKGADFQEHSSPRPVVDPSQLKVLEDARAIALEWATPNRLKNILSHLPPKDMKDTREIIQAMQEDILKESKGEVVMSGEALKEIGKTTAIIFRKYLQDQVQ